MQKCYLFQILQQRIKKIRNQLVFINKLKKINYCIFISPDFKNLFPNLTHCLSKPTRDIKCLFVDVQNLAFFSSKKSYFPVFEVGGDKYTRTVGIYLYNTPPTASYFPLPSGLSAPRILAEHIKVELNALEFTFIRLP